MRCGGRGTLVSEFESTIAAANNASRTDWLVTRPRRILAQNSDCRAPRLGSAAVALWVCFVLKRCVDNVITFGVGLGRTSAGLARFAYVFGSFQCLQGLECGSSPTSGTCFPCSGACEPLSVHKMFTYRPLRGLFCWPVLWLGVLLSCLRVVLLVTCSWQEAPGTA